MDHEFEISESQRRDVIACCLVCRDFVPQCHFYLFWALKICSGIQLNQIICTLSSSPTLCTCISELILDAGNCPDQSWFSTVPFRLRQWTSYLHRLELWSVDLSVLHPTAPNVFSCVRIATVRLVDVHYSSYTQLTRFFSISNYVEVYDQPTMTCEVVALRQLYQ